MITANEIVCSSVTEHLVLKSNYSGFTADREN